MRQLFVVCPCFNEEAVLGTFAARLTGVLQELASAESEPLAVRVLFVDDGSRDGTWELIRSLKLDSKRVLVSALRLSRNFGHQAAICAGLDHLMEHLGCGDDDTVVIMDS